MDFENILSIASQNQGLSSVQQKRYSLVAGPPKKDPKVKGVQSTAVQAFLKRKEMEERRKELENKRKKEELLAKRVELKSDRKARAMASRTKDNFKGYNGVPVVEQPRKRRSRAEVDEEEQQGRARGEISDDDEDNYEYSQTDSEEEEKEEEEKRDLRNEPPSKMPARPNKKPSAPAKPTSSPMNFAELLKLAQKKQFEPVELKPAKKSEERLRTAEELKELEFLERKNKKLEKGREAKVDRDTKTQPVSIKKTIPEKDARNVKPQKSSSEKVPPSGISKKPKQPSFSERPHNSAKSSQVDRSKHVANNSNSSGASSMKMSVKPSSQPSAKTSVPRPSSGQKPTATSDHNQMRGSPFSSPGKTGGSLARPGLSSSSAAARPSSVGQSRPGSSAQARAGTGTNSSVKTASAGLSRPGKGSTGQPGGSVPPRPASNGQMRPVGAGVPKTGSNLQSRPGNGPQVRPAAAGPGPGPGRPGGSMPGRPGNSVGSGPGRPKCTVVSETISSKNLVPRPGTAPRFPPGHRPMIRPPGPPLPPITSSYKRRFDDVNEEEEEYDSEMEDFIEDEGEDQDDISKHIREIFGYDKSKYRDESDYALRYMESSWKDQQKEEARSLRLGIKEDEEDMLKEQEEMKRKMAMNSKRRKH
ncbi:protein SPT2 homolog isoform X1 [Lepisosteus oculatus]|uniref:protein SPT2 homolog isoform X1 n=1 Tax=Lepisosteus oculatus TaxID=7918 RepID=UPI0035F515BD